MARMSPEIAAKYLGVQVNGQLSPCPKMPNCVCSQYEADESHYLEAISFQGTVDEAKRRLKSIIGENSHIRLVAEKGPYLRYEFQSKIFKFIDDVEFLIQSDRGLIQFRSASRLGQWDIGANKKRMQSIRYQFANS